MAKIVIIGGGIAGCAAALSASKAGGEVMLLERTDILGGAVLYAGLFSGNGRFTAQEEAKAMGVGDLFSILESLIIHKVDLPGTPKEEHVTIYNVLKAEERIREALGKAGVRCILKSRVKNVEMDGRRIKAVVLDNGSRIEGDVFVEATGNSGTYEDCVKYGFGCVLCWVRCPAFGSRISLTAKAGIQEKMMIRPDGTPGTISAAFTVDKLTLDKDFVQKLEKSGVILVPIPKDKVDYKKFETISASHNVRKEFIENLCVVDNGYAKVRVQLYMPLEDLRSIHGFERARMIEPLAGGIGNAVMGMGIALTDERMKVEGVENLFCAGSKADYVGITEAILSGGLAGHNALRLALGKELLILPRSTALGDYFAFATEGRKADERLGKRYSFASSVYFERMVGQGLYTMNLEEIRKRVKNTGLTNIFVQRIA